MELRQLRCFVTVADEQSFTRAAERLHFATSNVSQHIRRLEQDLGVKLLKRTSRRVEMTPAGRIVLERARQILADAVIMADEARQAGLGRLGTLNAAACPGAGHLVAELQRACAGANPDLDLSFATMQTDEAIAAVSAGRKSLAIARTQAPHLSSCVVSEEPQSFVAVPADHPLATKSDICLADLHEEPVLVIDEHTHRDFHDEAKRFFRSHGVDPDFRTYPMTSIEQCIELVATSRGLALLTRSDADAYPRQGAVIRPFCGPSPTTVHFAIWRSDDDDPQVAAVVALASRMGHLAGR